MVHLPLSPAQTILYGGLAVSVLDILKPRRTSDDYLANARGGSQGAEDPRHQVVADTLTHWAHHRGQLSVYLRLNDVALPSIYGPTADDKRF